MVVKKYYRFKDAASTSRWTLHHTLDEYSFYLNGNGVMFRVLTSEANSIMDEVEMVTEFTTEELAADRQEVRETLPTMLDRMYDEIAVEEGHEQRVIVKHQTHRPILSMDRDLENGTYL